MATGFQSLLVGGRVGWHTGSGRITYSYLGEQVPSYYTQGDTNGDGIDDAWMLASATSEYPAVYQPTSVSVSFSMAQRQMMDLAIGHWNEVARVNLVPGAVNTDTGTLPGTAVTGNGNLVRALGGPAGLGETVLERSDDGSQLVDLSAVFESGLNFFGKTLNASTVYVNNNGTVSFNSPVSSFSPEAIASSTSPLIAAFWADVDTRIDEDASTPDSGRVYVDVDAERDVVTFTWNKVGYYNTMADRTNTFQMQLFDRGSGDFDIVFRYTDINWTAGGSSSEAAHAGFSAGNGTDYFELAQSGDDAAVLNLENTTGNTGVNGLWLFKVRNGGVLGEVTFGSSDTLLQSTGAAHTSYRGFAHLPDSTSSGTASFAGDVWINSAEPSQTVNEYGHISYNTMLHELGHALGLEHPNAAGNSESNQYTVMSYVPHPSQATKPLNEQAYPLTPMIWDIQAMQQLYGANTATRNTATTYFGDGAGSGELVYQYGTDQMKIHGRDVILTIWDAGGVDLIDADDLTTDSVIDLRPGMFSTIGAAENNVAMSAAVVVGGRVINLIENATGGVGNDKITGNQAANLLTGGAGNDVLTGGTGNDTLNGGVGADTFNGGEGVDTAIVNASVAVTVNLGLSTRQNTGMGQDLLLSIESLISGSGNDKLTGTAVDNKLQGMGGDDNLLGLAGDDSLLGGAGNDVLNGGTGADTLEGSLGNDTLIGGQGADELWSGAGTDRFRFLSVLDAGLGTTADTIWDFAVGLDKIDLAAMDANSLTASVNNAFTFLLDGVFSGVAGQLTYASSTGLLAGDVNGDQAADFQIALVGNPALTAGDVLV